MRESPSRDRPVTVIIDATPTLTTDAAAALLRLLQHIDAERSRDDGADDARAVAS